MRLGVPTTTWAPSCVIFCRFSIRVAPLEKFTARSAMPQKTIQNHPKA